MQKHLAVALVAALTMSGLTAGRAFADHEIVEQPGDTMQSNSEQGDISSYSAASGPATGFTLPILIGPSSPDSPPGIGFSSPELPDDAVIPGRPIQYGLATWYGPGFDGHLTYCGDVYDEAAYTAASNTLPCGAVVIVTNQDNGASVRVRINDRGGFGSTVILDLSRAAFGTIASNGSGVIAVMVSQ